MSKNASRTLLVICLKCTRGRFRCVLLRCQHPRAVPNTSTLALTNATLRYAIALADKGWRKACHDDSALAKGLNIVEGKVVFKAVADVFGLPYEPLTI